MKTKVLWILLSITLLACNDSKKETNITTEIVTDTTKPTSTDEVVAKKEFANERFRKVTFEKLPDNKFRVIGEAQVFEATINWSVEDGHVVYQEGFTTASMGAPEWGQFEFIFQIEKASEIKVLNLLLYEISAQDGNQTHVLLIPLK